LLNEARITKAVLGARTCLLKGGFEVLFHHLVEHTLLRVVLAIDSVLAKKRRRLAR